MAVGRWDFDFLEYFSWTWLVTFMAIYTVLALFARLGTNDRNFFSAKNARPAPSVLLIHAQFLTGLAAIFVITPHLFPHLPSWLTDQTIRGRSGELSVADLLFVVGLGAAALLERRLLFVPAETASDPASGGA